MSKFHALMGDPRPKKRKPRNKTQPPAAPRSITLRTRDYQADRDELVRLWIDNFKIPFAAPLIPPNVVFSMSIGDDRNVEHKIVRAEFVEADVQVPYHRVIMSTAGRYGDLHPEIPSRIPRRDKVFMIRRSDDGDFIMNVTHYTLERSPWYAFFRPHKIIIHGGDQVALEYGLRAGIIALGSIE